MKKTLLLAMVLCSQIAYSQISPFKYNLIEKKISYYSSTKDLTKDLTKEILNLTTIKNENDSCVNLLNNKYLDTLKSIDALKLNKEEYEIKLSSINLYFENEKQKLEQKFTDKKKQLYLYRTSNKFAFIPVRNDLDAELFFTGQLAEKSAQIGENTNFVFNTSGQRVSIMNELYADYFGPIRLSFGALISNSKEKIETDSLGNSYIDSSGVRLDAVQKLLGGGGNGILQASYPLFSYINKNSSFNLKCMLSPKLSFNIPKLNETTTDINSNSDLGIDLSCYYIGKKQAITLFTFNRIGYVNGTSSFYDNLQLKDRKGFMLNQFTFGLSINSTFRLSYSIYAGNKYVKENFSQMLSFSIIPQ